MKRFIDDNEQFITSERIDLWKKISYHDRYLDALASILLVNSDTNIVAAVLAHNNKFYYSYNNKILPDDEKKVEAIRQCLEDKNQHKLLYLHLAHNQADFQRIVLAYVNYYEKHIPYEAKYISQCIKERLKSTKNIIETLGQDETIKTYFKILNYVQSSICNTNTDKKNYEVLFGLQALIFRPLQNVVKLCSYLDKENINILHEDLIHIPNIFTDDKKIQLRKICHAEMTIKAHFPLVSSYIGISKLCCGACHEVFEIFLSNSLNHRGTSGIWFNNWKSWAIQFNDSLHEMLAERSDNLVNALYNYILRYDNPQEEGINETERQNTIKTKIHTLEKKKLEERCCYLQARDLSDDEEYENIDFVIDEASYNILQLKKRIKDIMEPIKLEMEKEIDTEFLETPNPEGILLDQDDITDNIKLQNNKVINQHDLERLEGQSLGIIPSIQDPLFTDYEGNSNIISYYNTLLDSTYNDQELN